MNNIWILLLLYQAKHFICDYPLQTQYMLGKFKVWPNYILPLTAHCATHGLATFLIALAVKPNIAFSLALLDFCAHFIVDRVKASPSLGGRFRPLDKVSYPMAINMSKGFSIIGGEPLPQGLDSDVIESYKKQGRRDILSNKLFWWALGADQMAHHLTHYLIIYFLVR
jgi:hypothetical protein